MVIFALCDLLKLGPIPVDSKKCLLGSMKCISEGKSGHLNWQTVKHITHHIKSLSSWLWVLGRILPHSPPSESSIVPKEMSGIAFYSPLLTFSKVFAMVLVQGF